MGDQPQGRSRLVFELGGFLKGRNKEAGINRRLATLLNHSSEGHSVWFMILWPGGPWLAWGPVSASCLGEAA